MEVILKAIYKTKRKEKERDSCRIPQHEVFYNYPSAAFFMQISSWDNSTYGKSYISQARKPKEKKRREIVVEYLNMKYSTTIPLLLSLCRFQVEMAIELWLLIGTHGLEWKCWKARRIASAL
jgi:hypothetical protein